MKLYTRPSTIGVVGGALGARATPGKRKKIGAKLKFTGESYKVHPQAEQESKSQLSDEIGGDLDGGDVI